EEGPAALGAIGAPRGRRSGPMIPRLRDRLRRTDRVVLVAMLLVGIGVVSFTVLTLLVKDGKTQAFDEHLLRALCESTGPDWLEEAGRDMTAVGGAAVLVLLTAAVAGYLLLHKKYAALLLVLGATLGGLLLSTVLKDLMDRPRPEVCPHKS